MPITDWVASPA